MKINQRLPNRIAAGFKSGPEWKTTVNELRSGHEFRNKDWVYPRYRYTANFGAFSADDRQALIGIFLAAGGRWAPFRIKDPTDYFVNGEPLSPSVGTSDPVQLSRTYSFGPSTATVLIRAPVASTLVVYKDSSPVAVTVDDETGLVTPDATWAAGTYTFDCQYDRWVRFDSDWGAFTANAQGVWTADLELVEIR